MESPLESRSQQQPQPVAWKRDWWNQPNGNASWRRSRKNSTNEISAAPEAAEEWEGSKQAALMNVIE